MLCILIVDTNNCTLATLPVLHSVVVRFNFSSSLLETTEGADLPRLLSIVRNGRNEPDISFQVFVTPGTGNPNSQGNNSVFTDDETVT